MKKFLTAALCALLSVCAVFAFSACENTGGTGGGHAGKYRVNALEQNSGHLWFKLTVQDYSGIASYQGDGDTEAFCTRLNELNTLSMVEFDGAAMNTLMVKVDADDIEGDECFAIV